MHSMYSYTCNNISKIFFLIKSADITLVTKNSLDTIAKWNRFSWFKTYFQFETEYYRHINFSYIFSNEKQKLNKLYLHMIWLDL